MINSEGTACGLNRFCFWSQALTAVSPVFLLLKHLSFVILVLVLFFFFFFFILKVLLVKRYIFFMIIVCFCNPVRAVALCDKIKKFVFLGIKSGKYCI